MKHDKIFDPDKQAKWLAFIQELNPDIDPWAIRLLDEMRLVGRAVYHVSERSITASGLTYAKYRLLMALLFSAEIEDCRQLNPSQLSERQGVSRNTISSLIRDLEEDGLITRQLDQEDRRKFNIMLTENGRHLVLDHVRKHFRIIASCFHDLSAAEKEMMSRLLVKVGKNAGAILTQQEEQTGA